MRLVTYGSKSIPRLGVLRGEQVIDVAALDGFVATEDMLTLIDQGEPAISWMRDSLADADEERLQRAGAVHNLAEVYLLAPIPRPRKNIFCLGRNYVEHAVESSLARGGAAEVPEDPIFFTKATTTVNGPFDDVPIDPAISDQMDWEGELGVIIGRAGKNIPAAEAMNYIFGYTVLNDVTARDLQGKHKQWFKGKSLDGSCPMGPWIVTRDEIPDPHALDLRVRVNGILKQESNTRLLIFNLPTILEILSSGLTLEPGDMIATGTPAGVGYARKPPEFLHPGDLIETEIEGIGIIRNRVTGPEHR